MSLGIFQGIKFHSKIIGNQFRTEIVISLSNPFGVEKEYKISSNDPLSLGKHSFIPSDLTTYIGNLILDIKIVESNKKINLTSFYKALKSQGGNLPRSLAASVAEHTNVQEMEIVFTDGVCFYLYLWDYQYPKMEPEAEAALDRITQTMNHPNEGV